MLTMSVVAALLLGASACAHNVRPWQREHQARMQRQLDQRAPSVRSFEEHMWTVREGAAGGNGKAGGGCGCN